MMILKRCVKSGMHKVNSNGTGHCIAISGFDGEGQKPNQSLCRVILFVFLGWILEAKGLKNLGNEKHALSGHLKSIMSV